ncbi:hypothetical protein M231_06466 [Tremella mesenterica]|uniref:Uncharacterized protein n=1 Tax=Tremella mesenterica TaxID=5217 RepID=A0A4Q1BGB6_TREME|nr:hypothetical protein M231_06466 [Tremella mesenterica]
MTGKKQPSTSKSEVGNRVKKLSRKARDALLTDTRAEEAKRFKAYFQKVEPPTRTTPNFGSSLDKEQLPCVGSSIGGDEVGDHEAKLGRFEDDTSEVKSISAMAVYSGDHEQVNVGGMREEEDVDDLEECGDDAEGLRKMEMLWKKDQESLQRYHIDMKDKGLKILEEAVNSACKNRLSLSEVRQFFQNIQRNVGTEQGKRQTAKESSRRQKEMLRIAHGRLENCGHAVPVGDKSSSLVIKLAWSPATIGRRLEDTILTPGLKTPSKLLRKGMKRENPTIYIFDTVEPRLPQVDMVALPRYHSIPSIAASYLYPSRTLQSHERSSLSELLRVSNDHQQSILADDKVPRLILCMGRYSQEARDCALKNSPFDIHDFSVPFDVPPLQSVQMECFKHSICGKLVFHQGQLLQIYLDTLHPSVADFPSARNVRRFGDGVAIDLCLNWICAIGKVEIPPQELALFSIENIACFGASMYTVSAYAWTQSMRFFRITGQLEAIVSADLCESLREWMRLKDLQGVPDVDPLDSRSYMTRVWSTWQIGVQARRDPEKRQAAMEKRLRTVSLPEYRLSRMKKMEDPKYKISKLMKMSVDLGMSEEDDEVQRVQLALQKAHDTSVASQGSGSQLGTTREEAMLVLRQRDLVKEEGYRLVHIHLHPNDKATLHILDAQMSPPATTIKHKKGQVFDPSSGQSLEAILMSARKPPGDPRCTSQLEPWLCSAKQLYYVRPTTRSSDTIILTHRSHCSLCKASLRTPLTNCRPILPGRVMYSRQSPIALEKCEVIHQSLPVLSIPHLSTYIVRVPFEKPQEEPVVILAPLAEAKVPAKAQKAWIKYRQRKRKEVQDELEKLVAEQNGKKQKSEISTEDEVKEMTREEWAIGDKDFEEEKIADITPDDKLTINRKGKGRMREERPCEETKNTEKTRNTEKGGRSDEVGGVNPETETAMCDNWELFRQLEHQGESVESGNGRREIPDEILAVKQIEEGEDEYEVDAEWQEALGDNWSIFNQVERQAVGEGSGTPGEYDEEMSLAESIEGEDAYPDPDLREALRQSRHLFDMMNRQSNNEASGSGSRLE